ncbi:hypothetical protein OG21DRAFT_1308276 [Imleria badia]|nr:hypothetical protein OG21DRAFT_1308276 [Imleria badia]
MLHNGISLIVVKLLIPPTNGCSSCRDLCSFLSACIWYSMVPIRHIIALLLIVHQIVRWSHVSRRLRHDLVQRRTLQYAEQGPSILMLHRMALV